MLLLKHTAALSIALFLSALGPIYIIYVSKFNLKQAHSELIVFISEACCVERRGVPAVYSSCLLLIR